MYKTIKEENIIELIEKKSKFIGQIYPVKNKREAEAILESIKKQYSDATHNCYAYVILDEETNTIFSKSSDDGEPSGTAGVPILNVITNNKLVNVLVIITRYFGGILLGTGGLVRAYKESTVKAIENSKIYNLELGYIAEIHLDYSEIDQFKYYCKNNNININKTEFLEKIMCEIEIKIENFNETNPYYEAFDKIRQKLIISD